MFSKRFSRLEASSDCDSPCGSRPNCVCSLCPDADHRHAIAPLSADQAIDDIARIIAEMEGSTIVEADSSYLHATFKSRMGFVDDVELSVGQGMIHVRSASRLGYGDHGINRQRVEFIRSALNNI